MQLDDHHFRKPANDITSQLEINFGDLGRPGRGGPRGGRGGRGRGRGAAGGPGSGGAAGGFAPEASRPVRAPRTEKVDNCNRKFLCPIIGTQVFLFCLPKGVSICYDEEFLSLHSSVVNL